MIAIPTKDMSRAEWLAARQKGIGGSDIAAIMGLDKYKTALDVYRDKVGESSPQPDSDRMRFGRDVEPIIGKWFTEDVGLPVTSEDIMWQHPEHKFMLGNLDFVIGENDKHEGEGVLECKSTSHWVLENTEDEVPVSWYLQNQWYQMIKGYEYGYVAALVDRSLQYHFFEADSEIRELMTEHAVKFWVDHVEAQNPPPPTAKDDLNKIYSEVNKGEYKSTDAHTYQKVERINQLKEEIKALEAEKDELETAIKDQIGNAEGLTYGGEQLAKWTKVSYNKTDGKAVEEKFPDIAAQCQKEISFRRLYLKS